MTERTIQNHLWFFLQQKGHTDICPGYTPKHWWECDMFSVTKSGFMVEHEIKVTRGDFRHDVKKTKAIPQMWGSPRKEHNKHEKLLLADENGPSRFFYVVPADLIKVKEVPEWAGLVYATAIEVTSIHFAPSSHMLFSVVKDAPRLHTVKVNPKVLDHVRGVFYWRFWNERRRQK